MVRSISNAPSRLMLFSGRSSHCTLFILLLFPLLWMYDRVSALLAVLPPHSHQQTVPHGASLLIQTLVQPAAIAKTSCSSFGHLRSINAKAAQAPQTPRRSNPGASPVRARPQLGADAPAVSESLTDNTYAASALSRPLFVGSRSQQTLRNTLSRRPPVPGGRAGAMIFTLAFLVGIQKLCWFMIVKRTKNCPDCRGFGIARCELCHASGSVKWIGKWDHVEPCPECMGKRYHRCYSCGGLYHRPIFAHVQRNAGVLASQNQVFRTMDVINPLVD